MSAMNKSETLARAREQIAEVATARSQSTQRYHHTYAMGWLGALAATGLIDGPTYILLQGELDEALGRAAG